MSVVIYVRFFCGFYSLPGVSICGNVQCSCSFGVCGGGGSCSFGVCGGDVSVVICVGFFCGFYSLPGSG